ncbi:MAG: heavy metal-binding domain-containing protein [Candidatus Bathyarchaeota archaeon]|nr:heavy metal-binding domain-containing protein [Candidatus Bathyarchaeota archaeon]
MSKKSCSKCGESSSADAQFCSSCGASFATPAQGEVMVVTTPTIPGYEIVKVLGTVHGITVRTRGVGGKIIAGIEGMFGGEVTSYSSEAEKARRESMERLVASARRLGANAIVRTDFETSDILRGTATLFSAYGTAVVIKPATKS